MNSPPHHPNLRPRPHSPTSSAAPLKAARDDSRKYQTVERIVNVLSSRIAYLVHLSLAEGQGHILAQFNCCGMQIINVMTRQIRIVIAIELMRIRLGHASLSNRPLPRAKQKIVSVYHNIIIMHRLKTLNNI